MKIASAITTTASASTARTGDNSYSLSQAATVTKPTVAYRKPQLIAPIATAGR